MDIEKIKTIGDSYMAAGGIPVPNKTHAFDVVSAALEIQKFMFNHKQERQNLGLPFFDIRIGISYRACCCRNCWCEEVCL